MQTVLMVLVMATRHCCLRLILGGFKQQKAKSKTEKKCVYAKGKKKKKMFYQTIVFVALHWKTNNIKADYNIFGKILIAKRLFAVLQFVIYRSESYWSFLSNSRGENK